MWQDTICVGCPLRSETSPRLYLPIDIQPEYRAQNQIGPIDHDQDWPRSVDRQYQTESGYRN